MIKTIAVIEGDDAAPEAMKPVIALLDSLNIGLEWVYPEVGEAAEARTGSIFPDDARALLDGAETTVIGSAGGNPGCGTLGRRRLLRRLLRLLAPPLRRLRRDLLLLLLLWRRLTGRALRLPVGPG